ncbi:DNA-3-methyladenine glycosylase I [Terrabacter sp. Root181]|uniref:DNA-3-methyladenine glycosylase I n=1 Tax=Terrabacter sp. Root181 TaxID=1736484 RepID=UPI0006F4475E|nr:DNA-3-methyladenine glycosylase I [Terrabacter sp. Root181]KRB47384.1 3-methyladenine DNA glycosylase [Terrabacter sp. Root181]
MTVVGADGLARPTWASVDPLLMDYYDTEWGVPIRDERGLYERICLEGFQAGLSWATILRKRPNFRAAFSDFVPDVVATYTDADVERLLGDAGIIRHRGKIQAAITNARATIALRDEGGLVDFVWGFRPADTPRPIDHSEVPTVSDESKALSKALRKKGFAFVGPTTMYALMEAVGIVDTHLMGSHRRGSSGVWPD